MPKIPSRIFDDCQLGSSNLFTCLTDFPALILGGKKGGGGGDL